MDCANAAGLAVYAQTFQRRAHASRTEDCKRFNSVIRYLKRHKCALKSITLQYPTELVASINAAFKAPPEESIGLAFRGWVVVLCEDPGGDKPHGNNNKINSIDFTFGKRKRVVRSTCSAELDGLVDRVEQMLYLQRILY